MCFTSAGGAKRKINFPFFALFRFPKLRFLCVLVDGFSSASKTSQFFQFWNLDFTFFLLSQCHLMDFVRLYARRVENFYNFPFFMQFSPSTPNSLALNNSSLRIFTQISTKNVFSLLKQQFQVRTAMEELFSSKRFARFFFFHPPIMQKDPPHNQANYCLRKSIKFHLQIAPSIFHAARRQPITL